MASQASNHLPTCLAVFFLSLCLNGSVQAMSPFDSELNEAIQKKDWPSVVLLIQPKKGQNFEHDLVLSKALLSLERRQEALALLSGLQETHKDERTTKLFQSAGTIFFAQETSNLYYEAFEMIKNQKFTEAKEHLEQALLKEPGQVLVLTRLIQMELLLGQKEQASIHLKTAQANTSGSSDLKLFAAKLAIEKSLVDAEDENENELYRDFSAFKALLLENEVTLTFWAESLMRAHKTAEIEAFAQKMLKDHPQWTYALAWFRTNANPSLLLDEKLKAQIEKNLKDKNAFLAALETEMKRSDYFWVGYVNYDTLVALQKPTPTPAP